MVDKIAQLTLERHLAVIDRDDVRLGLTAGGNAFDPFDMLVAETYLLVSRVVEPDHTLAPDNDDSLLFERVQPGDLDMRLDVVRILQVGQNIVADILLQEVAAVDDHLLRRNACEIIQRGNIMRSKGLKNVFLRTHDAEFDAGGIHVIYVPDSAAVDQFLDFIDCGMEQQDMGDHEVCSGLFRDLDELLGLFDVHGHRLLDQSRKSEAQEFLADGVVRFRGSGDDIAVISAADRLIQIGIGLHPVLFLQLGQTRGIHIHDGAEIAHLMQRADMILAPAAASDHANLFTHFQIYLPVKLRCGAAVIKEAFQNNSAFAR